MQKNATAQFMGGVLTAASVFISLTLLSGILSGLPGGRFGRGLAVMSARLNGLPGIFGEDNDPPEEESEAKKTENAPSLGARLSRELIVLSGFGGWEEINIKPAPEPEKPEDEPPEKAGKIGGEIIRKTYTYRETESCFSLPGGGMIRNCTDISAEYLLEQAAKAPDFSPAADGPLILIMHTHTTECYESRESEVYYEDSPTRTTDLEKSVVKVGEAVAEELEAAGIGVIHDKTLHDYPQYTGAYDRSAETVAGYLKKYPSIKIVIDLHRDAIEEDGVRYAPTAVINGKSAAQVMMIVGCKNVPGYRYNLRIAARVQSKLESLSPGLTRPILFDERNYNQELTHGSFLVEVGAAANTLEEAVYAGELFGKALAGVVGEGW